MNNLFITVAIVTTVFTGTFVTLGAAFAGEISQSTASVKAAGAKASSYRVQKKLYQHHYRKRYHKKLYSARRHHRAKPSKKAVHEKGSFSIFMQKALQF